MTRDMNPMRPQRPVHHPAMVIDTPVPQGMDLPQGIDPGRANNIRNLIERLRGGMQQPQQVAPPPEQQPQQPIRSVLIR